MKMLRKLGLKLFSIALAVGLWLTVSGEPIAERGVRIPLAFENLPESMEILGESAADCRCSFAGFHGDPAAYRRA